MKGQLLFLQLPNLNTLLTKSGQAPRTLSLGHAKLCEEYFVREKKGEGEEVSNFKDEKELTSPNPNFSF